MLKRLLKAQLSCFLIFATFFSLAASNTFALYEGVRDVAGWDYGDNMCDNGNIDFDPFSSNIDINWELANPVCAGFITGVGTAMLAAGLLADKMCYPKNLVGLSKAKSEYPIPESPFLTPTTAQKMLYLAGRCGSRNVELGIANGNLAACKASIGGSGYCLAPATQQVKLAASDVSRCCKSYSAYAAAVGVATGALGVIYEVAKNTYDKARICGHDWQNWRKFDVDGNEVKPEQDGIWRRGPYVGSYQHCIESIFVHQQNPCNLGDVGGVAYNALSLKNKYYREYLYGGKEYSYGDSSNSISAAISPELANRCNNPWDSKRREKSLGYTSDAQRYYMKGPGLTSNYACHRFLTTGTNFDKKDNEAYECCIQRSQSTVCFETTRLGSSSYGHKFCEAGSRCVLKEVTFETFWAKGDSDYLCVKSYSLCPYNHLLGGGTERVSYFHDAKGRPTPRLKNFCQISKHCAKVPAPPYIRMSSLDGAYISKACKDLRGDTQNIYSFEAQLLPSGTDRGFSSPLVQCFKETMQNILLNKAGHTKCKDPDEHPDALGLCNSGELFQEGETLIIKSAFTTIQGSLRWIIKMTLTLAIAIYGAMILIGAKPIEKKQLFTFILKIVVIMYFALGNGWHQVFLENIFTISSNLGAIVMKLDDEKTVKYEEAPQDNRRYVIISQKSNLILQDKPEELKDGCQFPRFNAYLEPDDENRFNNPQYKNGLEYLKIWDILDCKLMRSLGYGPELSVPNLVIAILAGFFTSGLGIVFAIATFFFAFFFLSLILRAMHIFLLSTTAITILIFVSPITITAMLFEKTKSIFDSWLKQLIGFMLQPVILFAYLGIFIAIFDHTMIGPVTFKGTGKEVPKEIVCDGEAADKSMYCIFHISKIKTYSGLEAIGITIPFLDSMNSDKLNAIIKAALLMFIFTHFMDKVSALAAKLVGGSTLESRTPSALAIAESARETASDVQKRGTRASWKAGKSMGKKAGRTAKSAAKRLGDQGKSVASGASAGTSGTDAVRDAPKPPQNNGGAPKNNDDQPPKDNK